MNKLSKNLSNLQTAYSKTQKGWYIQIYLDAVILIDQTTDDSRTGYIINRSQEVDDMLTECATLDKLIELFNSDMDGYDEYTATHETVQQPGMILDWRPVKKGRVKFDVLYSRNPGYSYLHKIAGGYSQPPHITSAA